MNGFIARRLFASIAILTTATHAEPMPFIELDPARTTAFRERGSGRPFVSVGVNYFDPHTGWAPKLWQQFDEARVRHHLELIRGQGFNTIRVFLTLGSFHTEAGQVNPEGEAKFRKLLALCRELGLYLMPTGPDHWEGVPAWRQDDPYADEAILRAEDAWWRAFVAKFKDEPAILAWDIFNEPAVAWDSPAMRARWNGWLQREYGSLNKLSEAWARPAAELGPWGQVAPPPQESHRNDPRLFDYQRFRESLAEAWSRRRSAAIRSADPNHLLTIGHIQWAVPMLLPTIGHYAGFDMKANARYVDFVSIHFYPLDTPRPCDAPEGVDVNAVYLEALLAACSVGKPLMIGEFAWYGGGELRIGDVVHYPDRPAEHQVEWSRRLLEISRGRVCGWLNWAFADPPAALDLSRWSGCWTEDLKLKPWGEVFGRFAREVEHTPEPARLFPAYLSSVKMDRKALLTDPHSGHELRRTLRELSTRPAP